MGSVTCYIYVVYSTAPTIYVTHILYVGTLRARNRNPRTFMYYVYALRKQIVYNPTGNVTHVN